MNAPSHLPDPPPAHAPAGPLARFGRRALDWDATYLAAGIAILLLDLVTGRYLLFPILFVFPVTTAAWFRGPRLAYALAVMLPLGRIPITSYVDDPSAPLLSSIANAVIRVAVLSLLAYLVARTARQTRELRARVETLVTMCAWSRTIEYQGEWISFEEYLLRRFKINTTHGISPAEAEKFFGPSAREEP